MAVLLADGFPYATAQIPQIWTTSSTYNNFTIETGGRFNGRCLKVAENTSQLMRVLGAKPQTVCYQFGYKAVDYDSSGYLHPFSLADEDASPGWQIRVRDVSGTLTVWRGNFAAMLGSASIGITPNVWHQIEIKIKIDPSAGELLVKLDGVVVINETGLNSRATSHSYATALVVNHAGSGYIEAYYSDLIAMDTTGSYCKDLLGPRQVKSYVPTAAGYYTQWTPSTGANWQTVDEIPPVTTDYNQTAVVDNIDTFDHADMDAGLTPDAIIVTTYGQASAAGAAKLKGAVRSNGDDGVGTENALPSSWAYQQSIIYVDPDTGVPFTRDGFNAAEFGYKRSA